MRITQEVLATRGQHAIHRVLTGAVRNCGALTPRREPPKGCA
jgi:hypothetical protein